MNREGRDLGCKKATYQRKSTILESYVEEGGTRDKRLGSRDKSSTVSQKKDNLSH
jgi:hypothetical protein